jgi:hypothetical protein
MKSQSSQNTGPRLEAPLEEQLLQVREAPEKAIAFSGKAWLPYYLHLAEDLAYSDNPQVTVRLAAEAADQNNARVFRLAMVQLLGWRRDASADDALIVALSDPTLRPLASFLLGRIGYKGYPLRDRPARRILTALKPHLDDDSAYLDPWYDETYRTGDLVIAAFVRVAGVDRFRFLDEEKHKNWIGMELPSFDAAERDNLRAQCEAFVVASAPEMQPAL